MNDENCNYEVTGINAQFGYNPATTENNGCGCNNNNETCQKLLKEIRCLTFAITDLAEYLNTHPTDEKAICLHRKYCNNLNELKDMYQRIYGPLSIYCPCNKWRWLEEPWPWEGSEL
ncbi:MAG: spore coat protein CotJB [Christensenellales bacterium]